MGGARNHLWRTTDARTEDCFSFGVRDQIEAAVTPVACECGKQTKSRSSDMPSSETARTKSGMNHADDPPSAFAAGAFINRMPNERTAQPSANSAATDRIQQGFRMYELTRTPPVR